jgi:hypothetical protein
MQRERQTSLAGHRRGATRVPGRPADAGKWLEEAPTLAGDTTARRHPGGERNQKGRAILPEISRRAAAGRRGSAGKYKRAVLTDELMARRP